MLCIGFLRGINVGGKNSVAMAELKQVYESFGCANVKTVGNTGCIIYETEACLFEPYVEKQLQKVFGFPIPYATIPFAYYKRALREAPEWWGRDEEWRHNVMFLTKNYTVDQVMNELEPFDPAYDQMNAKYGMIFWSSAFQDRAAYRKSQYSRLAKKNCYAYLTIRNYNTAMKVMEAAEKMQKRLSR